MSKPRQEFGNVSLGDILQVLAATDDVKALEAEFNTFATNGIVITQAWIDTLNIDGLTPQRYLDGMAELLNVANYVRDPLRVAKLNALRRP